MAEDTTTVSDDDLQDVSLVDTPIAPKTDAPSETADTGTDDAAATQDKPLETAKEADGKPATETAEDTPQDQPETSAQPSQDEAAAARARAQQEYQNRARTRTQVAQQIDNTYGPKTEEDLVNEGMKPDQAAIQALREEMQFKEQRAQIAELNAGLQADAVNVYNDFPIFNPDHKGYDQEFAQMVEQQYQVAARLQTDQNGFVLNAEVPLYDFYKQMAGIYSRGASKGSEQGQQEALQMLARTENVGGSSASGNTSNDLAELEERLGDVVIT